MATLNYSGLPAGAIVTIQDNLYLVQRGAESHGLIVNVLRVPDSGQITATGLRESRYSLLFNHPRLVQHSVFAIDVGDPANFRRRLVHSIPPVVTLQTAEAVEDTVELTWVLSPEGHEAHRYSAWVRVQGSSEWVEAGAVTQGQARSLTIANLSPDTDYEARIRAENSEGRSRGYSNTLTVRTNTSTKQNSNLVVDGSFEKSVW